MEERITKCLDYKVNSWTFFDLAMLKISNHMSENHTEHKLRLYDQNESESRGKYSQEAKEEKLKKIEEMCSYLGKFMIYDYELFC